MIICYFFFFNDTATTEIYTLSLHDALPIYMGRRIVRTRLSRGHSHALFTVEGVLEEEGGNAELLRSEEHTSELQSRQYLVCRLLLEKKKKLYCITSLMKIIHVSVSTM